MRKYIILFFIVVGVTALVIANEGNQSTDTVPQLSNMQNINSFSCSIPEEKHTLAVISNGTITQLGYIGNRGQVIRKSPIYPDIDGYIDTFDFLVDGVQTNVKNPNLLSGKFCIVYGINGGVVPSIENGKKYYIYSKDKNKLVFSEVPLELDSNYNIETSK